MNAPIFGVEWPCSSASDPVNAQRLPTIPSLTHRIPKNTAMPNPVQAQDVVSTLPEPGQMVEVRGLRMVVSSVEGSSTPDASLPLIHGVSQHLVTLSSIEDDALGEELQVIWEIEAGAKVAEGASLPMTIDGFDAAERLAAFLDAVRWGSVSSADMRALQAPFRSGVEIQDYQLDPTIRALSMPRANLLIADDVGLGKTIEAGLVMQEMIIRHRARRVLIVCPSSLQIHWKDQMRDKFGLEFRIVDSALMKELRRSRGLHVNPWTHFPRLITSMDFIKRDRPMRLFSEAIYSENGSAYPRHYDLLIVDEAHNVAPSGAGRYAIDSQRTTAVRMIAPHFEHKLFLTATPHNGYAESFTALLEMIDNQRFARGVEPDPVQKALVVVRRLKTELLDFDGQPRFKMRKITPLQVDYTEEERRAHRLLQEYARLRLKRAQPALAPALFPEESPDTPSASDRTAVEFVLKLLKKRLFSSPKAFAITLAQHRRWLLEEDAEAETRRRAVTPKQLQELISAAEESDEDAEEVGEESEDDVVVTALKVSSRAWRRPTPEEAAILDQLTHWAEQAANRVDSKARLLVKWLKEEVGLADSNCKERVIIFSEYRATQSWLQQILANEGLASGERVALLYGGMDTESREHIKAAFQAAPEESPVRILLATDSASEGIDLQKYCHRVIHMEIPWNPNRLEQRNGRIDRYGQRFTPEIFHFVGGKLSAASDGDRVGAGSLDADLEFLYRVVQKVNQIREDLGSVSPVIADQVTRAMLGSYVDLDRALADADERTGVGRRQLKFERNLREQIVAIKEQLDESRRDLRAMPENIERVVHTALEIAGKPRLEVGSLPGSQGRAFRVPALDGSWSQSAQGLAHPFTGKIRPITFDPETAHGRDDVVLAHLNHPLVRLSTQLLRAEIWANRGARSLYRVTARVVPSSELAEVAVICHARLVIVGGDSQRLHEEIVAAGGTLAEGRFRRLDTVGEVERVAGFAGSTLPSIEMLDRLAALWDRIREPLLASIENRVNTRTTSLDRKLDEQRDAEKAKITAILDELKNAIDTELGKDAPYQPGLFTANEEEQQKRNRDALRLRVEQIPGEIEQETAQVDDRYAKRAVKCFPVAVTFLVPSNRQ